MTASRLIVPSLLFGSGFASLVYQIIWMRELGLLFGSTAHAAAGTLAVFFGGLAIGGVIWSRRAPRSKAPLSEYGLLEIGIGLSSVFYFGLMPLYSILYTPLHGIFGDSTTLLLVAKLALVSIVLLPSTILMGGTLPLMAQSVVDVSTSLGRVGTLLYGINTLGAATGALITGFWLPAWLGFNGTYLVAVTASLLIGSIAWFFGNRQSLDRQDRQLHKSATNSHQKEKTVVQRDKMSLWMPKLVIAAFGSGFLALALEVLWTRMFQQVLQNSVYTFSVILVTFLTALATGAFIARLVANSRIDPWKALACLMTAAAAGTLTTPFLFYEVTDGMRYLGAGEAWSQYLVSVFSSAAIILLLPGLAVGSVFPYLLRVAERSGEAGQVVGRLAAINTAGAIFGSLVTGFLLLGAIGLWNSILLVSVIYFVLAAWMATASSRRALLVPTLGLLLAFTVGNPSKLPGVRLNPETERLLAAWEGPDGYIAVVERGGSRRIKINNFYSLGSSAAIEVEQNQTLIPMIAHPSPERLFYLGMGTGITAGAALRLPSHEVTVTELVPEVITAAAEFFGSQTSGLFTDSRARVLARDGRNELRGHADQYDAIIADLFIPWRAGVGNLYSQDHYMTARDRLRPGGVYVQWIPLYQVTEAEFWVIIRTFLDVFPQVQVWRGDFFVDKPILALVGSVDTRVLSLSAIIRNGQYLRGGQRLDPAAFLAVTLPFYVGNLGESREIVPPGPIHTDDNPVIEYHAPISHRNARAGRIDWFTGAKLVDFLDHLLAATPPDEDPYLSQLDPPALGFVRAGQSYYMSAVMKNLGRRDEAQNYLNDFKRYLPIAIEFKTTSKGSSVEEIE